MKIEMLPIEVLIPYDKNPRKNQKAIPEVMKSLKKFGFRQPIVCDEDMVVIVGHTRLLAAKKLGMKEVPVHVASDMPPAEAKAYRLMDNRTSEHSEWDKDFLILELDELLDQDPKLDMQFLGFLDFDLSSDEKDSSKEEIDTLVQKLDQFVLAVNCTDEQEQRQIYEELTARGVSCKII